MSERLNIAGREVGVGIDVCTADAHRFVGTISLDTIITIIKATEIEYRKL